MHTILTSLCNRRMVATGIAHRARIIVLAFQKQLNSQIAQLVGAERHSVGRWRRRWQDSFDALLSIEMNESQAALERAIVDMLRDAHRSGSPGKFSAEQVVQLVSLACENPRDSDRPIEAWTGRELADEMQKQSLVDSISSSWVNELLRQMDLQPHRRKYWCFTTEKDRDLFQAQVEKVCQTYLQARSAYLNDNTHTVCVDEMTSLQANEHRAETKHARPGQIGKSECQYTRHGTLSLTGSWEVVQGQMIQTTVKRRGSVGPGGDRCCADFVLKLLPIVAKQPQTTTTIQKHVTCCQDMTFDITFSRSTTYGNRPDRVLPSPL